MTDKLRSAETVADKITDAIREGGWDTDEFTAIITARDREVERHTVERCKRAMCKMMVETLDPPGLVRIYDYLNAILETEDDNG